MLQLSECGALHHLLCHEPPLPGPQVSAALSRWDSSAPSASFVFTSSMGVCSEDNGGLVREDCPLVDPEKSPSQVGLVWGEGGGAD
jgi:hypothetical protein